MEPIAIERQIARWKIKYDPEATRACFARMPFGSGCDCSECRNFSAAGERCFPSEFFELAKELGIDPTKPAELCHYNKLSSGLYDTHGWYHMVGSLQEIVGEMPYRDNRGSVHFAHFAPGVEIGFDDHAQLVNEAFNGLQVIELNFATLVPWVLDEPEPEWPLPGG